MNGVFCPDADKRAQVKRMAKVGMPEHQIAHSICVSVRVLHQFYGAIILAAQTEQNLHVLETLARLARSGCSASATIFWAKSRCGFGQPPPPPNPYANQYANGSGPLPHCTFIRGPNGEIAPRR